MMVWDFATSAHCRHNSLSLVETNVRDVGQVDAAVGRAADVEACVVGDHVGEDV